MDAIILSDIPWQIDVGQLLKTLRISEGSADAEKIRHLAKSAQAVARPRAMFGVAYIESRGDNYVIVDGIRLTSRVLRVNLEEAHRVFPYAATCGTELDDWSDSITDTFERYWADAIKEAALRAAVEFLNERLKERFQPGPTSTMNPGSLEDWPMEQQTQLFAILGNPEEAIGLRLTDSFLMVPVKSVSGLEFPTQVQFESCQLCPREKCPGRRAPYDKDLYEKRYRNSGRSRTR